jgi:hypothetical protein
MAKKNTKKSNKLEYIDGRNSELEEQKKELSRLEAALAVKEKRNPFGTSNSNEFQKKLSEMTLIDMQSMAVACGVFPSGNKTTLKNKLIKKFQSKILLGADKVMTTSKPIVDTSSFSPEQKKLFNID